MARALALLGGVLRRLRFDMMYTAPTLPKIASAILSIIQTSPRFRPTKPTLLLAVEVQVGATSVLAKCDLNRSSRRFLLNLREGIAHRQR